MTYNRIYTGSGNDRDKEPRRMVDLGLGIGADRSPGPMKAQEMSMDDGD